MVLTPIVSKNDVPTTFNLLPGFVVPIPTPENDATAVWKSTSTLGIAEPNPTEFVKLT